LDERPIVISPSLLSADFSRLREEIGTVEKAGAGLLHVDVMDGHFVPNLTMGPVIVKAIKRAATVPLDVHLMIEEPARYAEAFVKAGADLLTYHVESREGSPATAERIRELGAKPGVTLRPGTPLGSIRDHLPLVDLVLVMSVEPGFSGQSFMPEQMEKVRRLREELGFEGEIEVDGGVGEGTIGTCAAAGANLMVAGSAVFGADDPGAAVRRLLELAEAARHGHR
jgi:ribulose-phosphate 3-epimerase